MCIISYNKKNAMYNKHFPFNAWNSEIYNATYDEWSSILQYMAYNIQRAFKSIKSDVSLTLI